MTVTYVGIEKLIHQAQADLASVIMQGHDFRASKILNMPDKDHFVFDSPIEGLFYTAMRTAYFLNQNYQSSTSFRNFLDKKEWRKEQVPYGDFVIEPQLKVLDWPVDFLVAVADFNDAMHYAVIECDGHEFHERTKEQAQRDRSRDRRLQELDIKIFRFTGSEIYRNPYGCAQEILKWADKESFIGIPG